MSVTNVAIQSSCHCPAVDKDADPSIFHHISNSLRCALLFCLMSLSPISQAEEKKRGDQPQTGALYGAMFSIQSKIYKDVDNSMSAFPIIGYRGEKLQAFGPFISYSLSKSDEVDFRLQLKPRFAGYDASDSPIFSGMAERDNSLDFGFGLSYDSDRWKIGLSSLHDILNRSGGTELSATLSRQYRFGPVFIEPNLNLSYLDRRYIDYYYGVEASEVGNNRPEYQGDSAINPSVGIGISTPIFFGGFTRLSITNTWYDSSITNSPLVDEDSSIKLFVSFTRFFDASPSQ